MEKLKKPDGVEVAETGIKSRCAESISRKTLADFFQLIIQNTTEGCIEYNIR